MDILILLSILSSFFICFLVMPLWINKCKKVGLLWNDMNKFNHPKNVASSGGVVVVFAFLLGVFSYIAFRTLFREMDIVTINILVISLSVLIAGFIGFVDDMFGWNTKGLSAKTRILLMVLASIPLIVINAGTKAMTLPFFGNVHFGILYPLFLIPLGFVGVTTVYNFLAGFNGLEAGQGVLILSFLSYVAYGTGNPWLGAVGLTMVFALLGFLVFNWNPANVFGGNILTYAIGSLIVAMAIIGNFEKIAVIVFIPYIVEMVLKVRGRFLLKNGNFPHAFGNPDKDNSLNLKYGRIYGMTHLSIYLLKKIKKKVYERDVVLFIFGIQILFILIAWIAMR